LLRGLSPKAQEELTKFQDRATELTNTKKVLDQRRESNMMRGQELEKIWMELNNRKVGIENREKNVIAQAFYQNHIALTFDNSGLDDIDDPTTMVGDVRLDGDPIYTKQSLVFDNPMNYA